MSKRFCLLALLVVASAQMFAQSLGSTFEITPYFDVHGYTWREFDDSGNELLKETGPRFSLGVLPRYSFLPKKNLYVEMDLQYALGTVDYEGFTFNIATGARTPYTTTTAYNDFGVALNSGYIFELSRTFLLTPVGGVGYEMWKRDIGNGNALGYDEKYSVLFANVGVNGTFIASPSTQLFAGVMLRMPFSFTETVDQIPRGAPSVFDITLSPGSKPRFVANMGGSIYQVFAMLYFETWTLARSADVKTLHQPESTRTHIGIKLGYTFKVM